MPKSTTLESQSHIPRAFIWRRLHSLMGIWLTFYLFEHLLINSQASLLFEDQGNKFVRMVNAIHDLPYLWAIEILLLGVPFFIHMFWGVQYLVSARLNSFSNNGNKPILNEYRRNHAYSWQRITSWILLIGIIAHVVHMRFYEYPVTAYENEKEQYIIPLKHDAEWDILAKRFNFEIKEVSTVQDKNWIKFMRKHPNKQYENIAIVNNSGTAFLLILREIFSNPYMVILYSIFVLAAAFHGFNGLWTFFITWGITLTRRSQKGAEYLSWGLIAIVAALGLLATIGTYFVTIH